MRPNRSIYLVLAALVLAGCAPPPPRTLEAIVGADLIDGERHTPIPDSIVLVRGHRFRAAGWPALVPIPPDYRRFDAHGKFLIPGLVDLDAKPSGDYLRYGVTSIAGPPSQAAAPPAKGPAPFRYTVDLTRVSTLADVQAALKLGKRQFLGMIGDTGNLDAAFLAELRDYRAVFAPMLTALEGTGDRFVNAMENTRRMWAAGIAIAVASGGSSGLQTQREVELLAVAGLSPLDVIAAATGAGARVIGGINQFGTIEPGRRADLIVLSADPLADTRNIRKVQQVMLNGEWVDQSAGR